MNDDDEFDAYIERLKANRPDPTTQRHIVWAIMAILVLALAAIGVMMIVYH